MPLFLETSTQIKKVIGEQRIRDEIRRNLNNQMVCTSGHVLAEYKKTLVRDAVTFRNLLLTSPTVGDAVKRFGTSYSRTRKYKRVIDLLETLGRDADKEKTLTRLESFIEFQAEDHFWESIDRTQFIDQIKCPRQHWEPERDVNNLYPIAGIKCLKNDKPDCIVNSFIEQKEGLIKQFTNSVTPNERQSLIDASDLLKSILAKQDVPYGETNCYKISDLLIVLESPEACEIYSFDKDIYEICVIFNRPCYEITGI